MHPGGLGAAWHGERQRDGGAQQRCSQPARSRHVPSRSRPPLLGAAPRREAPRTSGPRSAARLPCPVRPPGGRRAAPPLAAGAGRRGGAVRAGRAAGRKMANVQLEFQANAGEADPQSRPLLVLGQLHNLHRLPWAQLRGKLQPRVSEEVRPERRNPWAAVPRGSGSPGPALRGLGVRPESGPECSGRPWPGAAGGGKGLHGKPSLGSGKGRSVTSRASEKSEPKRGVRWSSGPPRAAGACCGPAVAGGALRLKPGAPLPLQPL